MQVDDADDELAAKVKSLIALHMGEELAKSNIDPSDRITSAYILSAAQFGATSIAELLDRALVIARGLRNE